MAPLLAQMVKNLPAVWETQVRSLGQEDPLEKEMAAHQYSRLEHFMDRGAWQATWDRTESDMTKRLRFTSLPLSHQGSKW